MEKTKQDRYCAFLRGVNVKGTNMKMVDVCSVFENSGMKEVTSVLASGNILFSITLSNQESKRILEHAMSGFFQYDAFLFVEEKRKIEQIIAENPFEIDKDHHIYVFIGLDGIETTLMEEFENIGDKVNESGTVVSGIFYWRLPKGNTLQSNFGKILGRKNLKDSFTSRNINTIDKIIKKL